MKRGLAFKLVFGGIAVVLVPLLVVGLLSAARSSKALEESSKMHSVEIAKSLAGMAEITLQEEIKVITDLSIQKVIIDTATRVSKEGVGKASKEVEELGRILSLWKNKVGQDCESLFVTDASGVICADSGNNGKMQGVSMADREYFKGGKAGKISIGTVVKSKFTGSPVVPLCAPLCSAAGEFVGVVVFGLKIDFLTNRIASLKLGTTGFAFLLDKNGLVISHPRKEYILEMNLATQEGVKDIAAKMIQQQTGTETYTFQGTKKLAGYAPIELTKWSIGVTQNMDEIMASARSLRNFIMLIGAIFLGVTLLAVLYFSRSITRPIAATAEQLDEAADQVASASGQVSSASQSLAEGASEQAAGLEETSSSIEEMASMTKQNADNAHQSKVMMGEAQQIVQKVSKHMGDMAAAIAEITRSSEETSKIIKTIDEIAFQTNLLALNAAVEAARAGEAGAGFAVVADEVRNLAMRASEAAKNTNNLIENTIKAVKNGNELTDATQEAFKENIEIADKIGKLIDEIAAASQEQSEGVGQINKAVAEMDKVVQKNAATAEESASAAEEMNAQAQQMKAFVAKLMTVVGGGRDGNGNGDGFHSGKSLISKGGNGEQVAAVDRQPKEKGVIQHALSGNGKKGKAKIAEVVAHLKVKETRPEQIIPLEEENFKEF